MKENEYISFQLHYFLPKGVHAIDALIHNECEKHILASLGTLRKYIGYDIVIDVQAKQEGGIIDDLKVYTKKGASYILAAIIGGWASNVFRPNIHQTEETLNRIEIINSIKKGQYTSDEIDYIIQTDKDLKRHISKFYRKLLQYNPVSRISAEVKFNGNNIIPSDKTHIYRVDFPSHVLPDAEDVTAIIHQDVPIYIVSPVLIKGSKILWKGLYNEASIDFRMTDSDFLKMVHSNQIKFGNGIVIICDLQVIQKIKEDSGKVSITYNVIRVGEISNSDDKVQWKPKPRYKIDAHQQSLF